jgi:hypothetical protein
MPTGGSSTSTGEFEFWYVNLQEPAVAWQEAGLAGIDTSDQALDLIIAPDLSSRWKDEDEFDERTDNPCTGIERRRSPFARTDCALQTWPRPVRSRSTAPGVTFGPSRTGARCGCPRAGTGLGGIGPSIRCNEQ